MGATPPFLLICLAYDNKPRCLICVDCEHDKAGKHHVCKVTGIDVTQEHFSLKCADSCPLLNKVGVNN